MLDKEERSYRELSALEELSFLKPLTLLKKEAQKVKPSMDLSQKKEYLESAALTPGGIFDEFNYFYFGYVSVDWMEVLFELYGSIQEWPSQMQLRVAHSLGFCTQDPTAAERKAALEKLHELEAEELKKQEEQDQAYSREGGVAKSKLYQRGRAGEDYFREFITGAKDMNRSTLISFLLFVKQKITLGTQENITLNRLNRILLNCGFNQLRPVDDFDRFVMEFLKSKNPMDVLEENVEEKVLDGKNFYLYQVYKDAYCHQKELMDYLVFRR